MKFSLKKLMISTVALLGMSSIGAVTASANSNNPVMSQVVASQSYRRPARRHAHAHHSIRRARHARRTHRVRRIRRIRYRNVRRHARKHVARKHRVRKARHADAVSFHQSTHQNDKRNTKSYDRWFARETTKYLYKDLNRFRRANHKKPLIYNAKLAKIAHIRAPQVFHAYNTVPDSIEDEAEKGNGRASDDWVHDIRHGQPLCWKYSHKYHLQSDCGENAGPITLGHAEDTDMGHNVSFTNHTPQQVAWHSVRNMMEYDRTAQWGHRDNIMDNTYVGASAYFQSKAESASKQFLPDNGGIAEEFE